MQINSPVRCVFRDMIDVLYDGVCNVLEDEELVPTIEKKLRELRFCSRRERQYKVQKIMKIMAAVNQESFPKSILYELSHLRDELKKGQ